MGYWIYIDLGGEQKRHRGGCIGTEIEAEREKQREKEGIRERCDCARSGRFPVHIECTNRPNAGVTCHYFHLGWGRDGGEGDAWFPQFPLTLPQSSHKNHFVSGPVQAVCVGSCCALMLCAPAPPHIPRTVTVPHTLNIKRWRGRKVG